MSQFRKKTAINDVTGSYIESKIGDSNAQSNYAKGWDAIFGKKEASVEDSPPFTCKYCGKPSFVDPKDQVKPPDFCYPSVHEV